MTEDGFIGKKPDPSIPKKMIVGITHTQKKEQKIVKKPKKKNLKFYLEKRNYKEKTTKNQATKNPSNS